MPGRREFFRELTHVLAHMEGLTTPSLIVLHLVNADDIRRRLGRNALDGVLIHVSSVIDTILEPTDVAGSLGGNDFGLIQLVSDLTLAQNKGKDLVQAIAAAPFQWQGKITPRDHGRCCDPRDDGDPGSRPDCRGQGFDQWTGFYIR